MIVSQRVCILTSSQVGVCVCLAYRFSFWGVTLAPPSRRELGNTWALLESHSCSLPGLGGPLAAIGQQGMGGVAQQGHRAEVKGLQGIPVKPGCHPGSQSTESTQK